MRRTVPSPSAFTIDLEGPRGVKQSPFGIRLPIAMARPPVMVAPEARHLLAPAIMRRPLGPRVEATPTGRAIMAVGPIARRLLATLRVGLARASPSALLITDRTAIRAQVAMVLPLIAAVHLKVRRLRRTFAIGVQVGIAVARPPIIVAPQVA